MKPVDSKIRSKDGYFEDCCRACIASLLELKSKQVPHFFAGSSEELEGAAGYEMLEVWLRERGYYLITVELDDEYTLEEALEYMDKWTNGESHYMLTAQSKTPDCNHSVICFGNEIVHEPDPDFRKSKNGHGIIGPAEEPDGERGWIFEALGVIV